MDVIKCLRSLLDLHVQLQKAVAIQGEIQAQFLAQLLHAGNVDPQQSSLSQLDLKGDDLELTLSVFERALDNSKVPKAQWGTKFSQLLCIKRADKDAHIPSNQLSYEALKADVRKQASASEYQGWRDFNEVQYDPQRGICELKLGVEEAAKKWLQPERCSAEEVVMKVALQKFLSALPPGAIQKTGKQQPRNMEEAAILAAGFLDESRGKRGTERDREDCETHAEHVYSRDCMNSNETIKMDPETVYQSDCQSMEVRIGNEHFEEEQNCSEVVLSPTLVDTKPVLNTEEMPLVRNDVPLVRNDDQILLPGACYSGRSAVTSPRLGSKNGDVNTMTDTKLKRVFDCSECGSKFKRFDHLRKHICTPGKSLGCNQCDQRFPSLTQLTNHLRIHRKMLHCPECNKAFRDRFNLRSHQRTHTGERPHICLDCGSAFAQERGLQEHRNIHTGEKPFQCSVCRKGFRHSRTLAKHVVVHSEARPFKCTDCPRTFKIKDNLKQHQKKMGHGIFS
ncbi:zinc finger and SCAN domain-containing protein 22-like [Trichomycterus rosablanca]|uniref:zinc finger and SCAN domain-containing protein 22-like n=1 Tax=Trichomycterus rosablanca TaxID=2290929 RepID=UPI002F35803F